MVGPEDSLYEGGFFNAEMKFPQDYPNHPPKLKFTTDIWHPNVFGSGEVCISILHPPGNDPLNPQESASERWLPIHSVETILLSVISILSDPNPESPANVDAAKELREQPDAFKRKVRRCVERSLDQ
mmetsp:Transcript_21478/g.55800  ORF Transcript_21478/g.55800 Transcript_21478/m.55800 type:complete len:127 (-) Transcript_21478:718-1098(-)